MMCSFIIWTQHFIVIHVEWIQNIFYCKINSVTDYYSSYEIQFFKNDQNIAAAVILKKKKNWDLREPV